MVHKMSVYLKIIRLKRMNKLINNHKMLNPRVRLTLKHWSENLVNKMIKVLMNQFQDFLKILTKMVIKPPVKRDWN